MNDAKMNDAKKNDAKKNDAIILCENYPGCLWSLNCNCSSCRAFLI